MRVGIVGGGFGLDAHLPAFNALPGGIVVAIADSGSGKVLERLPAGVAYIPSWRKLIEMDVDAVSVATPPAQQLEIVLAALARGKHVFCEKPFGSSLAQAFRMADGAMRAPDCVVAVNFQFRYEPGIALLKEKIDAGLIGRLRSIDVSWLTAGRASSRSPWSWRNDVADGGGVMGAFFSHVADLFCWLAASKPTFVFGQAGIFVPERPDGAGQLRSVTAEDTVTAQIEMSNGVIATCRITNCQPGGGGMRIEACGESGVLIYHHSPPFTFSDQKLLLRTSDAVMQIPLANGQLQGPGVVDSRARAVNHCVADFAALASGDATARPPLLEDGLRVQRIIEALRAAATSRQNVPCEG